MLHDLEPVTHRLHATDHQVPDDLVVFADANLLRRVFQNGIAEAIAYMPHGNLLYAAAKTKQRCP